MIDEVDCCFARPCVLQHDQHSGTVDHVIAEAENLPKTKPNINAKPSVP